MDIYDILTEFFENSATVSHLIVGNVTHKFDLIFDPPLKIGDKRPIIRCDPYSDPDYPADVSVEVDGETFYPTEIIRQFP